MFVALRGFTEGSAGAAERPAASLFIRLVKYKQVDSITVRETHCSGGPYQGMWY